MLDVKKKTERLPLGARDSLVRRGRWWRSNFNATRWWWECTWCARAICSARRFTFTSVLFLKIENKSSRKNSIAELGLRAQTAIHSSDTINHVVLIARRKTPTFTYRTTHIQPHTLYKRHTHSYFHVDFDGFAFFETEIHLRLRRLIILFNFLLIFHPFEMVLQGHIQIKRIRSIAETESQISGSTCRNYCESERSRPNRTSNSHIPLSSTTRITKYLELSLTASMATPAKQ